MRKCLIAVWCLLIVNLSWGAALTAPRLTPSRKLSRIRLTVTNGVTIYAGAMVAVYSNGEANNASDNTGLAVIGRAVKTVDNSDDGETVDIDIGVFRWANGAGSLFTDANIGDFAFVHDNQTVTNSGAANDIIAGVIVDVDSDGVWVKTMDVDRTAGSYTTLSASGAVTFSSTLSVGDAITLSNGETIDNEKNGDVRINGNLTPKADGTSDLGLSTNEWEDLYIDGTANIDSLVADAATVAGERPVLYWAATNVIMQAGKLVITAGGTNTVTFPQPFGSAIIPNVIGTLMTGTIGGTATNDILVSSIISNSVLFTIDNHTGIVQWVAIGAR